jgi:hypothetical protein
MRKKLNYLIREKTSYKDLDLHAGIEGQSDCETWWRTWLRFALDAGVQKFDRELNSGLGIILDLWLLRRSFLNKASPGLHTVSLERVKAGGVRL